MRVWGPSGVVIALLAALAVPAAAGPDDVASIAALARAAGPAQRPPLEYAIQDDPEFLDHPERLDATLNEIRELGFTHVRLSAHWDQLTRSPHSSRRPRFAASSPGGYEQRRWAKLDRAVTAIARHGLQPMVDAAFFAPRWATRGGDSFEIRPRNRIVARDFADFAVAIARRYSGRFAASPRDRAALPKVSVITLYNEPNLAVFWTPQRRVGPGGRISLDSPHAYRRLVAMAYRAVKRVRPDVTVLVGALASGQAWNPRARQSGIPAMRFLREMACVDGALRPLRTPDCRHFRPLLGDGLSAHPYSLGHPPDYRPGGNRIDTLTMGNLDRLTRLLRQLAARGRIAPRVRDVYLTEFGYLTPDSRNGGAHANPFPKVSPLRQGALTARAHELAWRQPQVRMFAQFLVRDTGCALGSGLECVDWNSGFRYADGRPKPLRAALATALLVTRLPGGDVAVWGRLGRPDLRAAAVLEYRQGAAWEPIRNEQVRAFSGGGADGIFSVRLRGPNTERFRVAVR
jgi:hypothetical protein